MTKKILLVDDDMYIRDLYTEILKDENYDVASAEDGQMALDMFQSDHFDLVLLDIMLPKIDGIQVLEEIKKKPENKEIPIIMLTNFGQEDLVKKAVTFGSADYLLKYNITPGEIVQKVSQLLNSQPVQL